MDPEDEANTQGDSGTTLRQRQPQGSVVSTVLLTCILFNYLKVLLVEFYTFLLKQGWFYFCLWCVWLVV